MKKDVNKELVALMKRIESMEKKKDVKVDITKTEKYKELMKKHENYIRLLEAKRKEEVKRSGVDVIEKKKQTQIELKKLTDQNRFHVNRFISDETFLKNIDKLKWYQFIKRIKRNWRPHVLIVIHRPDNYDIARYFPLEKNHIVDINGEKYMFNPIHFRYLNGQAILYFFWGNPFAVLINCNDHYMEPSISTAAFSSVLTSKFVSDAVSGEKQFSGMIFFIILIILTIIVLISNMINIVGVNKISKILGG